MRIHHLAAEDAGAIREALTHLVNASHRGLMETAEDKPPKDDEEAAKVHADKLAEAKARLDRANTLRSRLRGDLTGVDPVMMLSGLNAARPQGTFHPSLVGVELALRDLYGGALPTTVEAAMAEASAGLQMQAAGAYLAGDHARALIDAAQAVVDEDETESAAILNLEGALGNIEAFPTLPTSQARFAEIANEHCVEEIPLRAMLAGLGVTVRASDEVAS